MLLKIIVEVTVDVHQRAGILISILSFSTSPDVFDAILQVFDLSVGQC